MPGPRYNDAGVSQSAWSVVLVKNERNHSTKSPPLLCCTGVRTLSQIKYLFSLEIRKFLLKYTFERDPPPPLRSPLHSFRIASPQRSTAFLRRVTSLYVLFEVRLSPSPLVACIPFGKARRLTFDKLNQSRTGCIRNAA